MYKERFFFRDKLPLSRVIYLPLYPHESTKYGSVLCNVRSVLVVRCSNVFMLLVDMVGILCGEQLVSLSVLP